MAGAWLEILLLGRLEYEVLRWIVSSNQLGLLSIGYGTNHKICLIYIESVRIALPWLAELSVRIYAAGVFLWYPICLQRCLVDSFAKMFWPLQGPKMLRQMAADMRILGLTQVRHALFFHCRQRTPLQMLIGVIIVDNEGGFRLGT